MTKKLKHALSIYKKYKDNKIVKEYLDALHIMLNAEEVDDEFKQKSYVLEEKKNYKLIVKLPYKDINFGDGSIRQNYYDGEIEYLNAKEGKTWTLSFCLSLCDRTEEYIINCLREEIKEMIEEGKVIDE